MQGLYKLLRDDEVLEAVIEAISRSQSSLWLVQGQEDGSHVRPDSRYFLVLQRLADKGVKIRRFYFGGQERFADEARQNPGVDYVFAGNMDGYQRAVIIDGQRAFFKIGTQFAFTDYPELIRLLETYLEKCNLAAVGNLG